MCQCNFIRCIYTRDSVLSVHTYAHIVVCVSPSLSLSFFFFKSISKTPRVQPQNTTPTTWLSGPILSYSAPPIGGIWSSPIEFCQISKGISQPWMTSQGAGVLLVHFAVRSCNQRYLGPRRPRPHGKPGPPMGPTSQGGSHS